MDGLRVLGEVVPEHGRVIRMCEMGRWIALLGMDEVWELRRIAQEEDGCVVCYQIPVSFIGSELDRETSRVASTVVRTRLATDS